MYPNVRNSTTHLTTYNILPTGSNNQFRIFFTGLGRCLLAFCGFNAGNIYRKLGSIFDSWEVIIIFTY